MNFGRVRCAKSKSALVGQEGVRQLMSCVKDTCHIHSALRLDHRLHRGLIRDVAAHSSYICTTFRKARPVALASCRHTIAP
eukprot:59914-Prymnesium_polylepis.1